MVPSPEHLGPGDTEDWSALEHVIKRFVTAFRQGERPSLDDALRDGGNRQVLLVELAHTELELRLKAGEPAHFLNCSSEAAEQGVARFVAD
jgi:hypothetical protein